MKYKNIRSAIHNFGHSFMSDMNYSVDEGGGAAFIRNDLRKIHEKGEDILIDWIRGTFEPASHLNERIAASIQHWRARLPRDFDSLQVDASFLKSFVLSWRSKEDFQEMLATDDRARNYTIQITKTR